MRNLPDGIRYTSDLRRIAAQFAPTFRLPEDSIRHVLEMQRVVDQFAKSQTVLQMAEMSEHMSLQLQPLLDTVRSFGDATTAVSQSLGTIAVSDFARLSTRDLDFAASVVRQVNAARALSVDFAGSIGQDLNAARALGIDFSGYARQLHPIFEQLDRLIVDAPDESTRRYTLHAAVRAIFEAVTGTDTHFDSPRTVMRFWLILALLLWSRVNACHQAEMHRAEIGDVRRVHREQAETIAVLIETVRQLTEDVDELKAAQPKVYLEIREPGILREAPSGQSVRLGRLTPGQVVRLLTSVKRWRYVELLDENLQETAERGWIYRRKVTPHRPASTP